jgi:hypothetical protein
MFSLTNPYLTIGQEYLVGKHIASGKRPPRPNADASIGFSDAIWTAIEQCWTQEWEPRRKGWEALVEILDVDTSESGVDAVSLLPVPLLNIKPSLSFRHMQRIS